jgi:hypothetical protein
MTGAALLCIALSAHAQTAGSQSKTKVTQNAQSTIPIAVQDALQRIATALEAVNAPKDAFEKDARAERDVRAQEKIARLAPKMFWLGVAEIFLTGVGVGLLYLTWRET